MTAAVELSTAANTKRIRTDLPARKSRPYAFMIQEEQNIIGTAMDALSPKLSRIFARRSFLKDPKFPRPPRFDSIESSGCDRRDGRKATAIRHWFAAVKIPISA